MVTSNGLETVPDACCCFSLGMYEQMEGHLIDTSITHKYYAAFYLNICDKQFRSQQN